MGAWHSMTMDPKTTQTQFKRGNLMAMPPTPSKPVQATKSIFSKNPMDHAMLSSCRRWIGKMRMQNLAKWIKTWCRRAWKPFQATKAESIFSRTRSQYAMLSSSSWFFWPERMGAWRWMMMDHTLVGTCPHRRRRWREMSPRGGGGVGNRRLPSLRAG